MTSLNSISPSYRLFLGFSVFIFLANLLVMNDFASLWNGAEVLNIEYFKSIQNWIGINTFSWRLPSVCITILAFVGIYFLGRKVFGELTTIEALLVLGSSLLVVNMGKVATGDSWLFFALSLSFISLILFLKQPILKWKISYITFLILAAFIHQYSTLVFSLGTCFYLFASHPKGENLRPLLRWTAGILTIRFLYFHDFIDFSVYTFYLSFSNLSISQSLIWMMIGMLPWTGFLWAGIWEMIQKLRKKEEFALIISAGFFGGLFSHALILQCILAFMIARQISAYFRPNYPYKNIVKTGAILHLLFAFGAIMYVMISSFDFFQAIGFRSAMAVGAVYWMTSLTGVIGLVGMNRRFIKGGMALSGLMLTLIFWLQLYPLIETQRNLPKRIALEVEQMMEKNTQDLNTHLFYHYSPVGQNLPLYLKQKGLDFSVFNKNDKLFDLYQKGDIIVVSNEMFLDVKKEQPELEGKQITGWSKFLKEESFWVLKK